MRRSWNLNIVGRSALFSMVWSGLAVIVFAQQPPQAATRGTPSTTAGEPLQVVIEREPLLLKPPETYHVPLHLVPVKSVKIAAPIDGIVNTVLINRGEVARPQAEIVRLDSRERQLELERAKAVFKAAKIEHDSAEQGTSGELADARLEVARIERQLAEFRVDQSNLRAPFDGTVQEVHVVKGQFVRAGEPLVTLVDTSDLMVQIPVDRLATKEGDQVELQVEGKVTSATVQGILPLTRLFEPLRELFQSIATGIAVVDNGAGQWQAGQTVYTSLIPRSPVTEVPNIAIGNGADGTRLVRVIRDGFVREVPVDLLGAVGEERTIVTGPFGASDELVVRSSEELQDGTQVVPRSELVVEEPASPKASTPRPAARRPFTPPPPK